jgi:hypothetical protein
VNIPSLSEKDAGDTRLNYKERMGCREVQGHMD